MAGFIENCWYVAAWDHELTTDGLFARTVCALPLVMWRDSAGQPVALEDRCCHRGAPLSLGRREGDGLRCLYHGLCFDAAGRCIEIPGQEHVPAKARVRAFPLVERSRWVWVWMGDPALADPTTIPDTHWLADPGWRCQPGYLHYAVNHLFIADNLLDFSHLPFVHPTTLGGSEQYARERPQVERLERGVRVTRWVMNIPPPPFVTRVTGWTGPVDRWNIYDFSVPGILVMDSGSAPAGPGAREGHRAGAAWTKGRHDAFVEGCLARGHAPRAASLSDAESVLRGFDPVRARAALLQALRRDGMRARRPRDRQRCRLARARAGCDARRARVLHA